MYFSYGKALLENAVTQSSVLGKEQAEEVVQDPAEGTPSADDVNFRRVLDHLYLKPTAHLRIPTNLFSPSLEMRKMKMVLWIYLAKQ